MHSVVPRNVMKPKQQVLRTARDIGKSIAHRRIVLAHGIASVLCAIKTDALLVRPVVVSGIPVGARLSIPPRRRAVVVASPHNMMKTKRSHVIDESFVRL